MARASLVLFYVGTKLACEKIMKDQMGSLLFILLYEYTRKPETSLATNNEKKMEYRTSIIRMPVQAIHRYTSIHASEYNLGYSKIIY